MKQKGFFFALEGGEGSGKSSVLRFLKEQFAAGEFIFTREPGGSPLAEELRALILSEKGGKADALTQSLMFWAARADHLKDVIRPHIEKGVHVITDRFDGSTYAYQVHGKEAKHLKEAFTTLRNLVLGDTPPDLYIFMDVTVEEGLRRRRGAGDVNHFDAADMAFHERVREGYLEHMKNVPHVVIDATKPLEEVQLAVLEAIKKKISGK